MRPTTTAPRHFSKAKSTLHQLVREWAEEGAAERASCYGVLLGELRKWLPVTDENRCVGVARRSTACGQHVRLESTPMFAHDGCPNCCVASIARADMSFIGTWRDDIRIDQEAVAAYIGGELKPNGGAHAGRDWGPFDIHKEVIGLCPTECMWMEDNKLMIENKECTRCMHCIDVMPRALRTGEDRGLSILVGAKAPILDGAQMGSMLVPLIKAEEPYDEIKEVIENIWDWWMLAPLACLLRPQ